MALISAMLEILYQRPWSKNTLWNVLKDLFHFTAPLCIAVFVGIALGWGWKPKWAQLLFLGLGDNFINSCSSPSPSSPSSLISTLISLKWLLPTCRLGLLRNGSTLHSVSSTSDSSVSHEEGKEANPREFVQEDDLEHLWHLVQDKDAGPAWIQMMDRTTPNMSYQAWRREPQNGPPEYRSRTVYEEATPEIVRDFFWDDEFRLKWDDMLLHAQTVEECPTTGTVVVQWIRKFPFFCSNREYIIGRRIWESEGSYYCITKGVPCDSIPRRNKPRRVDSYYSSWFIRAVESNRGDGQLSACEVLLFHHEEMGIPWEIAKLGVRQGMWGAVKKIDPGLRLYQKERELGAPLSRCALMAQISTTVSEDYLRAYRNTTTGGGDSSEIETFVSPEKPWGRNIPKMAVIGGVIILACSLDRGLLTKAVIFGAARRFANIERRL